MPFNVTTAFPGGWTSNDSSDQRPSRNFRAAVRVPEPVSTGPPLIGLLMGAAAQADRLTRAVASSTRVNADRRTIDFSSERRGCKTRTRLEWSIPSGFPMMFAISAHFLPPETALTTSGDRGPLESVDGWKRYRRAGTKVALKP